MAFPLSSFAVVSGEETSFLRVTDYSPLYPGEMGSCQGNLQFAGAQTQVGTLLLCCTSHVSRRTSRCQHEALGDRAVTLEMLLLMFASQMPDGLFLFSPQNRLCS